MHQARLVFRLSWFKARNETASALRPSGYFLNQAHLLPANGEVPAWDNLRCSWRLTASTASARYLETWNLSCTMSACGMHCLAALMYAGHISMATALTDVRCSGVSVSNKLTAATSFLSGTKSSTRERSMSVRMLA